MPEFTQHAVRSVQLLRQTAKGWCEVMQMFYEPTAEHIDKLSSNWTASYSGGKDSTSLVIWIEWLRRSGQINCPHPKLVQSDTEVEYAILADTTKRMINTLTTSGWECVLVKPRAKALALLNSGNEGNSADQ